MALVDQAALLVANALIGGDDYELLDAANAHIGVGNGTDPEDASLTDLTGTQKARGPMDAGFPTRDGTELTFRSTFGEEDANFAWEEWGIFNAESGGQMFNRKVQFVAEKTSAATFRFTVSIDLDVAQEASE